MLTVTETKKEYWLKSSAESFLELMLSKEDTVFDCFIFDDVFKNVFCRQSVTFPENSEKPFRIIRATRLKLLDYRFDVTNKQWNNIKDIRPASKKLKRIWLDACLAAFEGLMISESETVFDRFIFEMQFFNIVCELPVKLPDNIDKRFKAIRAARLKFLGYHFELKKKEWSINQFLHQNTTCRSMV